MRRPIEITTLTLAALIIAACGQASIGSLPENAPSTSPATPTLPAPTATAQPEVSAAPSSVELTFEAETYRDEALGFELDYPAEWDAPGLFERQSRGSIVQASMDGQVVLDIVTLQWDPEDDLRAYTEMREQAFEGSGFTILEKKEVMLEEGWEGFGYKIETVEGEQAYFFFTTIYDRYLQLSGSGDLDQLAEIASTLRTINE